MGAGDERLSRKRVVGGELDPGKTKPARDDRGVGALEDPQLRVPIRLVGAVPVEMVGLEIEEDGDAEAQLVDVLELERRELAHDPVRLRDGAERIADVARDGHVTPGRTEDRAEELDGGRLAVRPRDAKDGRRPEEPIPELDLRPHGESALARGHDERRVAGNTGRFHDDVHAVEQREIVLVAERAVDEHGVLQPRRSRPARSCEPVDERPHVWLRKPMKYL